MSFFMSIIVPADLTLDVPAAGARFEAVCQRHSIEPVLGYGQAFKDFQAASKARGTEIPDPEEGEEWEFAVFEMPQDDLETLASFYREVVTFCVDHRLTLYNAALDEDVDLTSPGERPSGMGLLPPAAEVAQRALALLAVVQRVHEPPTGAIGAWVEKHGVATWFSADESAFFFAAKPTEQQYINFSWRTETLVVLLWSLGQLEALPSLSVQNSLAQEGVIERMFADPEAFVAQAALREQEEIDELEAAMEPEHWRVRDARLHRRSPPNDVDPSIVRERRYATCWLLGDSDDWDDVPTDT